MKVSNSCLAESHLELEHQVLQKNLQDITDGSDREPQGDSEPQGDGEPQGGSETQAQSHADAATSAAAAPVASSMQEGSAGIRGIPMKRVRTYCF